MPRFSLACLAALVFAAVPVHAAKVSGPVGLWDRDDGLGGVRIAACGSDALCGHVVWLRDANGPAHVGQRVLYDMHRTAENVWTGSAVNPADGQTYAGTMTLSGSRLTTRGCAFGGMICQSVGLSRAR